MSSRRTRCLAVVVALITAGTSWSNAQAPILKNFSFGKGRPAFSGEASIGCGTLNVVALNAEPFGQGFRNTPNGDTAQVSLRFSKPVRQIDLGLSFVRSDEYLTEFNVRPASVSNTLALTADRVTTTRPFPSDDGAGIVTWQNVDRTEITFSIGGPPGTALAIDGFRVECRE